MTLFKFVVLVRFVIVIMWSLTPISAFKGCPADYKDLCDCGFVPYGHSKKLTYVTNCTNAGFDNTMMLRNLPNLTEVLIFVGNEIRDLPPNIFGLETKYDRLHTIDFSDNHIQTIKGRTFHNVANVTQLILNDNDLYIVSKDHHPRMFSNFVSLKELHLRNAFTEKVKAGDYLNNLVEIFENSSLNHLRLLNMENNEISGIHFGEFCSLPALQELYLADNHLKDISMNFSCLKHLKILDIGNNRIEHLSDETINNLEMNRQMKLDLSANPFRCDCKMIRTYQWMQNTLHTLINSDHFYCDVKSSFPPNSGKRLSSIDPSDLQCLPTLKKIAYHSSASIVLTVALICLAGLVGVLLYKNRAAVGMHMHRVVQPLRSKFRYVSLERRQTTMDV